MSYGTAPPLTGQEPQDPQKERDRRRFYSAHKAEIAKEMNRRRERARHRDDPLIGEDEALDLFLTGLANPSMSVIGPHLRIPSGGDEAGFVAEALGLPNLYATPSAGAKQPQAPAQAQPLASEPQGQDPTKPPDLRTAMQEYERSKGAAPDLDSALKAYEGFAMARGLAKSEEAQGLGEHAKYHGMAAIKSFADGIAHAGVLGAKTLQGISTAISGSGFNVGWEAQMEQMLRDTGTTDPDSLDIITSIGKRLGLVREDALQVGQQADELIQRRLGNWAIASQTAGSIAAFATGPGANIGRGASAVVKPVSMLGERILARAAGKGAPSFEAGRVWDWMAETPQWLATASTGQRMLAAGGRSIDDLLSVTAANVAQSYAMAPDDMRKRGAWVAAETSWLMLPIARMGQELAGRIAAGGLTTQQAMAAKRTYDQLSEGAISLQEADQAFKSITSGGRMALANLVSGSFEGAAFVGITPEGRDLYRRYMAGDSDAGAQLVMMGLGSVAGVVASKYAVPQELAPLFKHVRPDLNRLDTYIQAEANKRAAETLPQEPPKPDADAALDAEIAAGQRPIDEQNFRAWEAKQQRDLESRQRIDQHFDQSEIDTRAKYGWAEPHTTAALRAGFDPEFIGDSQDVMLRHGKDFSVTLRQGDEPTLVFDDKVAAALKEAGRDPEARSSLVSPGRREAKGKAASKILDDLALLAAGRQQQGDLTYTRLGFREVMPGIWTDAQGQRQYTMQLDGSSATRDPLSSKWTGREDVVTVAGYGEPKWDHPTVQALAETLAQKEALAPNTVVDGILAQAILQARHSDSIGAGQLRALFESIPPEAIGGLLRPGSDEYLALLVGSLGSGNSNAPATALEMASPQPQAGVARARETSEPRMDEAVADHPETVQARGTDVARIEEAVEAQPTLSERLDPGDMPPEPGSTMEAGANFGPLIKKGLQKTGKLIEEGSDYLFATNADRLQKALPNDPDRFVERGRLVESEAASTEQAALKAAVPVEKASKQLGRKWRREVVQLDSANPDAGTVPAWVPLADALVPPRNAKERKFQEGMQAVSRTTWDKGVETGVARPQQDPNTGEVKVKLMEPRARQTTQRVFGEGAAEVFGTDALRRGLFETFAKYNPDVKVPDGKGGRRSITADDIEAQWIEAKGKAKADIAENENAIEMMRQFKNVPYTFRGKEVFETNPFRVVQRIARGQSARVATIGQFGQSMPEPVRAELLKEAKASGKSPRVQQTLSMRGIESAVESFGKKITNLGDEGVNESMRQTARDWAEMLQARTPDSARLPAGRIMRGIQGVESFVRSMMTSVKTGLLDIPEMATLGISHFTAADTWRAIKAVAKNPHEAIRYAHEVAVIDRDMADHNWMEAKHILDKLTAGANFTNNWLERAKGAILVKIVDQSIARMKAGTATINDRQVVRDLVRLTPEQEVALLSGKASPQVYQLYRRAATRFMSAKEGMAGGSKFAASQPLNLLFRFGRFMSRRVGNQIKVMVSVQRAAKDHGWDSKQTGMALWRAGKMMGMNAVGGVVGQALGFALMDAFRGENGFKRYWDTLSYAPFATVAKAFRNQTLMGPLGSLFGAAMEPDNPKAVRRLLGPLDVVLSVADAYDDLKKGDLMGLYKIAADSGAIPLRREGEDLLHAIHAWAAGANQTVRGDAKAVNSFKRMAGITPSFGPKNKPDEFYDALDRILGHVDNAKGDNKAAVQAAMDDIRQALALAPEESVAGAIRGHQLTLGLTPDQRHDMAELLNDDARMTRIYQHDEALRQLAKSVDRMEGTHPTPLAEELALVTQQARLGASDKWGGIADRAVENATQRLMAGEAMGSEIDEVAMAMAQFPQQLGPILPERVFRTLQHASLDATARARRIAAILRNRAVERRKAEMKERAKEKRDGG